jgi:hypothetical protein
MQRKIYTSEKPQTVNFNYSKPSSSNEDLSNADSIIRVKMNANNYLPYTENSIISGLPNTL